MPLSAWPMKRVVELGSHETLSLPGNVWAASCPYMEDGSHPVPASLCTALKTLTVSFGGEPKEAAEFHLVSTRLANHRKGTS